MSSNNNGNSGIAIAIGLVVMVLYAIAIFIAAFMVFLTFVCTLLALMAWNRPLRIHRIVITPEEARGFVKRGLFGALVLPMFLVFVGVFLELRVNWDYLLYYVIAGYTLASLGVEILLSSDETYTQPVSYAPAQPQLPPQSRPALPAPKREPFEFASWDDEDA